MSAQQKMPDEFKEKVKLENYANTFFGFGKWEADYWLVGLEERGAKTLDEFYRRYNAWRKMGSEQMVDLREFFQKSKSKADPSNGEWPEWPKWDNPTWKTLRSILLDACVNIGELDDKNEFWGGSKNVKRGSGHIALIEVSPFPAPSTKDWPYGEWIPDFMKKRSKWKKKFQEERLRHLDEMLKEHKPIAVIDYGNAGNNMEICKSFKKPILYQKAKIDSSLWISPVKIAGAGHFSKIAKTQTSKQLKNWLYKTR